MSGAYEVALHLTGEYPDWWTGRRFDKPTNGWVIGKNSETVRDTIQVALLGVPGDWGTGTIPRLAIQKISKSNGDRADVVTVKHISGGISTLGFKSNDQGRQSFEGTARDFIWADEEISEDVWFECMIRTMTTDGILFTTFTPMKGTTDLINNLIEDGDNETPKPGVGVTTCSWDDVPHLTQEVKDKMWDDLPPHQRLARSKGVPKLGSGVIYPVDPEFYTVPPFEIPKHWKLLGGIDVGWRLTAALWAAVNPDDNSVYIYSEHYRAEAEPVIHAEAFKARGKRIRFVIDTAAHGRSQVDGQNLFDMYSEMGVSLANANKSVETGIWEVWTALSAGRLKIMNNCHNLLKEMKSYHRNDKGQIVKSNDHACDALRYIIMGIDQAQQDTPSKIEGYYQTYNPTTKVSL